MQTTRIVFTGDTPRTTARFRMARRTTLRHQVELVDENGDPVSLTGATLVLAVKKTQETDDFLIRKPIVDGGENDFAAGKFVMRIDPADTVLFTGGWYVFGIGLTLSLGTYELLSGELTMFEGTGTAPVE